MGRPSETDGVKKVAVIGGGLGCAIAYPQAKKLHSLGAHVDMIAGFRNKDIIILEEEMKNASSRLFVMTDDGSNGNPGFVTNKLEELLESGEKYDEVIAIGPLMMMKFVCKLTEKYGIKTIVSMNPIMIDGTGMCGGCRLTVGGKTKFACVDGPDFDGHLVDFDEVIRRAGTYKAEELGGLSVKRFCEAVRAEGVVYCWEGGNNCLHTHKLFTDVDLYHVGKPTRIAFSDRDVRELDKACEASEKIECFEIPWFKHFDKERIEQYALCYRKVVENYKDLLEHDNKEKQGGRWFGLSNDEQ